MPDSADPTPDGQPVPLGPVLRRVLGVLVEKAKTTPGSYPMTVNAIVTGCNQKSNRDPVTDLDEADVMNALRALKQVGAVEELDWLGRAPKYKHLAYDWLSVDRAELAVLAELLLRGAQTMGELRGRAARMEPIADVSELEPIVAALVQRGLMIEVTPPGRGQVVSHNLYLPEELAGVRSAGSGDGVARPTPGPASRREVPAGDPPPSSGPEIARLRTEVAELRRRVEDLEERLAEGDATSD
jgi:hypothetical protein